MFHNYTSICELLVQAELLDVSTATQTLGEAREKGMTPGEYLTTHGGFDKIEIIEAKAPSVLDAMSDLRDQFKRRDPFSVFCLMVHAGKGIQLALCGLDRNRGLIPFGNLARPYVGINGTPEPPLEDINPENFSGTVVLPAPSGVAHHAGQLACVALAALCFVAVSMLASLGARLIFTTAGIGLLLMAMLSLLNAR